jgi:hypothetical protein
MEMLGYHTKIAETRNNHRIKSYQRMALFLFFSMARVRNNRLFSMWSLIGASVYYGTVRRASARYASVLFGHACHLNTLLRLTQPFRERLQFRERVTASLNSEVFPIRKENEICNYTVNLLVFDNAQKNYSYLEVRAFISNFVV